MIIPIELKNKLVRIEGDLKQEMDSIEVTCLGDAQSSFIPGRVTNEFTTVLYNRDSIDAVYEWLNNKIEEK